jgi:hypothetical protein
MQCIAGEAALRPQLFIIYPGPAYYTQTCANSASCQLAAEQLSSSTPAAWVALFQHACVCWGRCAGEAPNEAEAAREHDEAVRRDDVATQGAATHKADNHE